MQKFILNFYASIKKNSNGIIIMLFASLLTSLGQLLWKLSDGENIRFVAVGFICYGFGAVLMIIAFRYGSLSVLHPMLSLSYVFAIIFGYTILKEHLTLPRMFATFAIISGVALIGGGDA